MTKKHNELLLEHSLRDSFIYISQELNKHQPTMQQLADAYKRASNVLKESKQP